MADGRQSCLAFTFRRMGPHAQAAIASASGSQLPLYAASAKNVVWVVGAQKLVKDLDAAQRRLREHALPLEDARARKAYGVGSAINLQLVVNRAQPGRITMVIVKESLGF